MKRTKHAGRFSDDDCATNIVARSELMVAVIDAIKEKGWTQAQAAKFLGVAQPRISDVVQGHVDRFTVDMLMLWLQKLGKDVSVSVRDNVFDSDDVVQLCLYVCGKPDENVLANVAKLFGGNRARYNLQIVDVLRNPVRASEANITATPSLVKESPLPVVCLTGDMSAASVRWQLAVAAKGALEHRQRAQDLRQASQDMREEQLDKRERFYQDQVKRSKGEAE